jgi:hypothetical protein
MNGKADQVVDVVTSTNGSYTSGHQSQRADTESVEAQYNNLDFSNLSGSLADGIHNENTNKNGLEDDATTNPNGINGNHINEDHDDGNHVNGVPVNDTNTNCANTEFDTLHATADTPFSPIAIYGMVCRLPGGFSSPEQLWDFLMNGGDARSRVPETRFNIAAYHSSAEKPGASITEYGYFLDKSVDLEALDTSFFCMGHNEVARIDPQQRLLLEVARESIDDAGEVSWKGSNTGIYVGTFSQDWYDAFNREPLEYGVYQATATHDFMVSERISHEVDLRGPRYSLPIMQAPYFTA